MRRFFATTAVLSLLAGAAYGADPVKLLTQNTTTETPTGVLNQVMPPVVAEPTQADKAAAAAKRAEALRQAGPDKVELAALYYYADQKQTARVEAEFRRLKFKYPNFALPKDLYLPEAARGTIDEKVLWAFYDKNDIAGIETEMARRVNDIPGWQPSADFAAKFARKKQRLTIEAATRAKDWPGVISAASTLDAATEMEVDLLWDLIDAYSAAGNKTALAPIYRAILFRDAAHALPKPVIIATIQKATRDFSAEDIRAVMARFAIDPVISAGLVNVSVDLIRKEVADFNVDKTKTVPLPRAEIDALTAAATRDGKIGDFSLLGWYFIKVKQPTDAGAWFRRALDKEQNAEHAKGLYLSLVQQERQDEAYKLALKYKAALTADPIFLMNALAERFTKPQSGAIDAEAVTAYSGTILKTKSGDHAEILAWYAYNSGQYQASRAWFTKAFGWGPNKVRLMGLALSEAQLNDRNGLIALYRTYGAKYPDIWDGIHLNRDGKNRKPQRAVKKQPGFIDEMRVGAVDPEAETETVEEPVAAPVRRRVAVTTTNNSNSNAASNLSSKNYGACVQASIARESRGPLSADGSLTKAWCLLGLGRTAEAKNAFSAALSGNGKTQGDAAYGLALTLLRGKLTDDAEAVANLYPMTAARDKEIRAEIYWQKARSSFDHKQYQRTLDALNARIQITPEPANMSQLRGWAHFNLGNRAQARAIFQRLAEHLDDPGVRRGLAATGGDPGAVVVE